MRRTAGLLAGLLMLTGCGSDVAASGTTDRSPAPGDLAASPATPTPPRKPTPTPPPPTCPSSGASITVGPVEAALGHRAVVIKLTNCRSRILTLNGYPDVAVLDGRRHPIKVNVTHGLSYMAIDPGPTKIHLRKGESALAAVSWSNTVEAGEDKSAGTYLSITSHTNDRPTIWPVDTDLGTTAHLTLTAWCLKFLT